MKALRKLVQYRDVLYMLVWREVKIRYKQSVLGAMWALLMPLIIVTAGVGVRFAFAAVSGGKVSAADIASVAVKSAPYGFVVAAIRFGTLSLVANSNLLTKAYVPRLIFPLASVLAQLFDFAIASVILAIALVAMGIGVSIQLFWLPILVLGLLMLVIASAVLLSAASLFFRDVKYLVEAFLTFAIFFVPVFYESRMMGKWERFVLLNPVSPILEAMATTVVGHTSPSLGWLGYSLGFGIVFLLASFVLFGKLEPYFAESV